HRVVEDFADSASIVSGDDVRMRKPGDDADFLLETAYRGGTGQLLFADDLEGHGTAGHRVVRFEDLAHAAFAEAVEQLVRPELQLLAAALQQHVALVRSQPAALNQLARQRGGIIAP